jgi:hypothetical protein
LRRRCSHPLAARSGRSVGVDAMERAERNAYATHTMDVTGGGRATSLVLCDCCQRELKLRAAWSSQAQSVEPQNALEVREQHLNLLAIAA